MEKFKYEITVEAESEANAEMDMSIVGTLFPNMKVEKKQETSPRQSNQEFDLSEDEKQVIGFVRHLNKVIKIFKSLSSGAKTDVEQK